jgi:hypothetical protein
VYRLYNWSLKEYANGTLQLKCFSRPILTDQDKFHKSNDSFNEDDIIIDYDIDTWTPWGEADDVIDDIVDNNDEKEINNITVSEDDIRKKREHSIQSSKSRAVSKICDYGRNNIWEWFFTFCISPDVVENRFDYDECCKKVRRWLNNIQQRKCPNMKYLFVPEIHPTSGAYHFHALVSNVDELTFVVAQNQQKYRKDKYGELLLDNKGQPVLNKYFGNPLRTSYPNGDFIYNVKDYKNGWSTATKIRDTKKAVSYLSKYITKDLVVNTFGKKKYFQSQNCTLPNRYLGFQDFRDINDLISFIEYNFNSKMSMDFIKHIYVNVEGYDNKISILEFYKTVDELTGEIIFN